MSPEMNITPGSTPREVKFTLFCCLIVLELNRRSETGGIRQHEQMADQKNGTHVRGHYVKMALGVKYWPAFMLSECHST
jgi:hypothetical protein